MKHLRTCQSRRVVKLRSWAMVWLVAVTALSALDRYGFLFDLFAHFRFQYAVAALLMLPWCLAGRDRLAAMVCIGSLVANGAMVVGPYSWSRPPPRPGPLHSLRIMQFNVLISNDRVGDVANAVLAEQPDLLFLQEVHSSRLRPFARMLPNYEPIVARVQPGIAAYRRVDSFIAVDSAAVSTALRGTIREQPIVRLRLRFLGHRFEVMNLHAYPPLLPELSKGHRETLDTAIEWSRSRSTPHVIVGDFNMTPWSASYRYFQAHTGLVNAERWLGPRWSWAPPGVEPLALPIDHVFHTGHFRADALRVLGHLGSDHRPIVVDLRFWPDAGGHTFRGLLPVNGIPGL